VADDKAYGATVAKRRLAGRLVAMRLRSVMSLNEASDKLGWSRGRLNRFEANQWRQPDPSHVRDLARIYAATAAESATLEELVIRTRLWWHEPEKERDRVFTNKFPGFENDAARISVYMPLVLWGTPADRSEQIDHLLAMSGRADVELRLLQFADGPHPGMSSLIDIFEFHDNADPPVVYLENDTDISEVTKPATVHAYQDTFARIRSAALSPAASRARLTHLSCARNSFD
jgi:hypothetical protein